MAAEYEGVYVQGVSVSQRSSDVTSNTKRQTLECRNAITGLGENARSLRRNCWGSTGDETARRRRCDNLSQVVGIASSRNCYYECSDASADHCTSAVERPSLCTGGKAASQRQQYGPVRHTAVDLATETDSDVECLEPDNAGSDEESNLPTCPICKPFSRPAYLHIRRVLSSNVSVRYRYCCLPLYQGMKHTP